MVTKNHWKPILVHVLFACWKLASHHSKGSKKKHKHEKHPQRFLRILVEKKRCCQRCPANVAAAPEDSCFNRPAGCPVQIFFSIPPMPTQPTGAANRGGVKKLTSIRTLCWGIVNFKRESENEALSLKWNHRETTIMLLPMIYFGVCCDSTKGGRVPN